jgi:hypothetical protein
MHKDEKERMVRVVKQKDAVVIDRRQRLPGRGAYVHARRECVERAGRKGGLARTLRMAIPQGIHEALAGIVNA